MSTRKFQQGGGMTPTQPNEEQVGSQQTANQPQNQQQQGSPEEQLMTIARDIIQQMGPDAAGALAQMIMQMIQGGESGQQPTFQRRGGMLVKKY